MMRPFTPIALPRAPLMAPLLALLVAGCGHSPATTFLVLDAAPPAVPVAAYAGPPLRVPFVHLPVTLDRPELVRHDRAGTLAVEDFARWSAPLGLMARDTLVQDLTQRLPAGTVLPPDAPGVASEVRVEPTVLSADFGSGTAAMTISYRLVRSPAAAARPRLVQLTATLADDTPAGRAQAWSRLLGDLSDRIVADLAARP
jgi:hypothetical protein